MNIIAQGDTLMLEKNGIPIGHCQFAPCKGAKSACIDAPAGQGSYQILQFEIMPSWQRKGYGTFLLKDLLRRTGGYDAKRATTYRVSLSPAGQAVRVSPAQTSNPAQESTHFPTAFFAKFGFVPCVEDGGNVLVRRKKPDLTATIFVQQQICQHLAQGGITAPLCIDATCGNGHDSLFLAGLLGTAGQLLALDIQPEAIAQTKERLQRANIPTAQYRAICADHATLAQYAMPCSADVIVFNFGWLPGADHTVFSQADSSIAALAAALNLLKAGGLLCATLYSGAGIGNAEKESVLHWLQALPIAKYTVLTCQFANWSDTAPLPCFVFKK